MVEFSDNARKGELMELKVQLNAQSKTQRKEALKKTIAWMTIGRDVSSLFTDVLNCMQTQSLEIKKLVYLYIVNYAQTKPDLALLAVNSFVRDSADPNPLLRALAIRTMACIRVDKIVEYAMEPLDKSLRDKDAYVRKTAAICVAKLYHMNAELVEEQGFVRTLTELLTDGNPTVVANAVAALADISEHRPNSLVIDDRLLRKLLYALNECNEWGQVFILDTLAGYSVKSEREADAILERVTARLQHNNAAVVLGAARLIIINADLASADQMRAYALQKLSAPLVTLLGQPAEIQYVTLRNLRIVAHKYPELFSDVKVFFCKYNDAPFVKFEKLELLTALVQANNFKQLLTELQEYAVEVDVEFSRRTVDCIARIGLALDVATDMCVEVLINLFSAQSEVVIQQVIIAMRDIVRKYPGRFDAQLRKLGEHIDSITEPEARAALVWILGEYPQCVDDAHRLMDEFMENFGEEPQYVQLQLLEAAVKLSLWDGTGALTGLAKRAIDLATRHSHSSDLRDRGHFLARLLTSGADIAKRVIFAQKPAMVDSRRDFDDQLRLDLYRNVGTVSATFMQPSSMFPAPPVVSAGAAAADDLLGGGEDMLTLEDTPAAPTVNGAATSSSLFDLTELAPSLPAPPAVQGLGVIAAIESADAHVSPPAAQNLLDDLFGAAPVGATPANASVTPERGRQRDSFGADQSALAAAVAEGDKSSFFAPSPPPPASQLPLMLDEIKGKGLRVSGALKLEEGGCVVMQLRLENMLDAEITGLAVQFNKNAFGLQPANGWPSTSSTVDPHSLANVRLPLRSGGGVELNMGVKLQFALKCAPCGVVYMMTRLSDNLDAVLDADGKLDKQSYLSQWRQVSEESELTAALPIASSSADMAGLSSRLEQARIFTVARPSKRPALYLSARTIGSAVVFLIELTASNAATQEVHIALRALGSPPPALGEALMATLTRLLKTA